jgi:hypothetical protein
MNRLTPRMRWVTLTLVIVLALLVLPAIQIVQSIRSGKNPGLQRANAEAIAKAVTDAIRRGELTPMPESSTEAFNLLLRRGIVTEAMFYVHGFAPLKRRPDGNGTLEPEENGFALVVGLPENPPPGTPVLLWDPELGKKGLPSRRLLRVRRWLIVDASGRASQPRTSTLSWWGKDAGSDFLPGVAGEQRLLRP